MRWMIAKNLMTAVLLISLAPVAIATENDVVNLTADRAEVRDLEGISIYRGNVVLTRGDMRITGDLMHVYSDEQRRLDRVEVDGTPATWRQRIPDALPREAEAPRMEYYATGPERLVLKDGGRLWQGDDTVSGEIITHFPDEARTVAEGSETNDDRVRATFYPDNPDDG